MKKFDLQEMMENIKDCYENGSLPVANDAAEEETKEMYLLVDSEGKIKEISELEDIYFRLRIVSEGVPGFMKLRHDQFMVFDYSKVLKKNGSAYLVGQAIIEIKVHEGDCISEGLINALGNLALISVPMIRRSGAVNAFDVSDGFYLSTEEEI